MTDLKKKPAKQWLKSARRNDLIVTSNGEPVAILLPVGGESLESTRALMRSIRALQAQSALQQAAVANGASELSAYDVDAEIATARRDRNRK